MSGKLAPERLNSDPVRLAALMVSGAVPDEVRVTEREELVLTVRSPKLRLLPLRVSAGTAAPRLMA